jgi:Glyoxalase-like domain
MRAHHTSVLVSMSVAVALVASTASLPAQRATVSEPALDHIIVRVSSLERGMASFAALTGVWAVRGGQHPGRGTENALVSLGDGHYLELLAPINPDKNAAADSSLRLGGWALHTRDLTGVLQRLEKGGFQMTPARPGSRRTTEGKLLEWRSADLVAPALEMAPFLIEWGAGTPHPSTTSPTGCQLGSVEVESPQAARLGAYLREIGYQGQVRQAASARSQVVLTCPKGRVTLSS